MSCLHDARCVYKLTSKDLKIWLYRPFEICSYPSDEEIVYSNNAGHTNYLAHEITIKCLKTFRVISNQCLIKFY